MQLDPKMTTALDKFSVPSSQNYANGCNSSVGCNYIEMLSAGQEILNDKNQIHAEAVEMQESNL